MMNEVLEKVHGLMPKILDAEIPDVTGPSMQLPKFKWIVIGVILS